MFAELCTQVEEVCTLNVEAYICCLSMCLFFFTFLFALRTNASAPGPLMQPIIIFLIYLSSIRNSHSSAGTYSFAHLQIVASGHLQFESSVRLNIRNLESVADVFHFA